jgi:hypothetical protein
LVVGFLVELELPAVVQELAELPREPSCQILNARNGLLDLDLLLLFFFCLCGQALPRQTTPDKVH